MRPEQVTKLAAIEEELIDVFVSECKPGKWPGMKDVKDRGDRYWHKKNALATLTLAARIQTVLREINVGDRGSEAPKPTEADGKNETAAEAASLARQGIAILERHRAKRKQG